jgi:hypothetical protein
VAQFLHSSEGRKRGERGSSRQGNWTTVAVPTALVAPNGIELPSPFCGERAGPDLGGAARNEVQLRKPPGSRINHRPVALHSEPRAWGSFPIVENPAKSEYSKVLKPSVMSSRVERHWDNVTHQIWSM